MPGSIVVDSRSISINLPQNVSLAVAISIIERALTKRNRRIASVTFLGEDIFNAKVFNLPWSSFEEVKCETKEIETPLKKAVVTLAIGNKHEEMQNISHPTMQAYAKKTGADFVVIKDIKLRMTSLLFEKWQMFDLLFEYDRILFLDTDILVAPDCPNLFNLVPLDKVGAFAESDYKDCKQWILDIQKQLGNIGWEGEYLNSGVGVYSYIHRAIFDRTQPYVVPGDQHTYNYRIKQMGFKVFPLSINFNHMELCRIDHLSSYLIHYAGSGFTGIDCSDTEQLFAAKLALMKDDLTKLMKRK